MGTFQWNHIKVIILASALAMIALLVLQAKWLAHSKVLIEEQFNQKVSMAMCMTVADLGQNSAGGATCAPPNLQIEMPLIPLPNVVPTLPEKVDEMALRMALDRNLALFDIPLHYEVSVQDKSNTCLGEDSPGCCSMVAINGFENHLMVLAFPSKTRYFLGRMGLMIGSSILILLLISSILWLATHYLIQQKRISEHNKDFFNNMAHEFKTPLTNIKLATSLLTKKQAQFSENTFINIIQHETKNLTHQIERVLHLSNLEKGAYQLLKEEFKIATLLQAVITEMDMQTKDKEAVIQLDIPRDIRFIGDTFHLKNAFRNLIDNALKYSSHTPVIIISLRQEEKGILLVFKDNGIGISKSNQAIIFDKFQRVGTGDVHDQKGFGVGLAYVKKVVELHQGFIKIVSEINKGSQFSLFLPQEEILMIPKK